jgi:hypothetical protein
MGDLQGVIVVRSRSTIDNPDLVAYGLYESGGVGRFVDVEDVSVKCHELAPERFSWRRFSFPNYKTLYKALRDFEAKHPEVMLKTADGLGRQLTAEGISWVEARLEAFRSSVTTPGANPAIHRPTQKMLNDLASSTAAVQFAAGARPSLSKYTLADLLMCAPDSPPDVWRERIETYRSAASGANRPDLIRFLEFVRESNPDLFRGRMQ